MLNNMYKYRYVVTRYGFGGEKTIMCSFLTAISAAKYCDLNNRINCDKYRYDYEQVEILR